jgi:vacuolar-type H+-ATPase catalytic subunit A/Vma1
VAPGDIIGSVYENDLFNEHRIMIPPKVYGRVTEIQDKNNFHVSDIVCTLDFDGKEKPIAMSHFWPVRQFRPVTEKLAGKIPLLTGQRVLDALFPSV